MLTLDPPPYLLAKVKITYEKSAFRPENGERQADVWFEVCHEEAVPEVIGEAVLVQVVVDQSKEGAVGLSFLVRHHSYDTGDVDAAQKSHQDESLENQGFNIAQNYTFHGQKCCLGHTVRMSAEVCPRASSKI